jgi:uncharacterized integral membrane protein (TIGR00698 family)
LHSRCADARWRAGFDFAARPVLRAGIALLAFRVTLTQLATLGWPTVATVVVCIATVFVAAWVLGRLLRIPPWFAAIAATSVAICGASAALAAAAALPKRPRLQDATLFVCVAVSLIGTFAMILYPTLAHLANWNSASTAVFLGASIHEVAQVVGAAFALSPEQGELATLTKLLRVAMLARRGHAAALAFRRAPRPLRMAIRSRAPSRRCPGFSSRSSCWSPWAAS